MKSKMNERFIAVDARFDSVEKKLNGIGGQFEEVAKNTVHLRFR
ncbi:hypothetical protein HDC33_001177 [Sporosarcina sp. JAI121]|nr:hypothetical protein [Sporosarcina sp. JAI121]